MNDSLQTGDQRQLQGRDSIRVGLYRLWEDKDGIKAFWTVKRIWIKTQGNELIFKKIGLSTGGIGCWGQERLTSTIGMLRSVNEGWI